MFYAKVLIAVLFLAIGLAACFKTKTDRFIVADSQTYAASMFRQNCAICHGPEAEGKTLEDGRVIPNLRGPIFKYKTDAEIYNHISDGGNGMVPFRDQLTKREIDMLVKFVQNDLRGQAAKR